MRARRHGGSPALMNRLAIKDSTPLGPSTMSRMLQHALIKGLGDDALLGRQRVITFSGLKADLVNVRFVWAVRPLWVECEHNRLASRIPGVRDGRMRVISRPIASPRLLP